jgi:hypothetical protein
MVKVNAPAMSLDASGTIGKALVFSKWKGRNYVRSHVTPSNPKSQNQISVRAMMRFLSQYWATLSAGDKATWLNQATQKIVSEFNAYTSYNLTRHRHYKAPSKAYPAAEVQATPSAPTTTATALVRSIQLSIADGATPPQWGWMIHRSVTTGFTPSFSNVVRIIPRTATPTIFVDTPLTTGIAQFYRIRGISVDGVQGTLEVERTANPT